MDSTDPVGPGKVLFTPEFYGDCARCLAPDGIMITQCGLPFLQPAELKAAYTHQNQHFANPLFYAIAVPAYSGGIMALGFARKGEAGMPGLQTLVARAEASNLDLSLIHI